jgi:FkbM family methyltransferase
MRRPLEWRFPTVAKPCLIRADGVGLFSIRPYSDDLFHSLPGQEPAVERIIRSYLKDGATFVDAGANIGFYTILASKIVGPRGKVLSIEMIPETAKILRRHIHANDCHNVTLHEGALASKGGEFLSASIKPGHSGASSIAQDFGLTRVTVKTITLADILEGCDCIHLMKMDLEGAELGALEGLGNQLKKVRQLIFEERSGFEVSNYLETNGYSLKRIDSSNVLATLIAIGI